VAEGANDAECRRALFVPVKRYEQISARVNGIGDYQPVEQRLN
jgi:hypothetical protein